MWAPHEIRTDFPAFNEPRSVSRFGKAVASYSIEPRELEDTECLARCKTAPYCRGPTRLAELTLQVEHMPTIASGSAVFPVPMFPEGVHVHWETQRRVMWNDRQYASEEHELVYEISWVEELGLWRTFLRSHHKVKS